VNTNLEPNTVYYWRVRAFSAIDTSNFSPVWTFTTATPVGINEYFNDAEISIYPNPAKDVVNIKVNSNQSAEVALTLYDLLGQAVLHKDLSFKSGQNNTELMLGDLSNGIYLLKMVKDDQVYTNKIIISR